MASGAGDKVAGERMAAAAFPLLGRPTRPGLYFVVHFAGGSAGSAASPLRLSSETAPPSTLSPVASRAKKTGGEGLDDHELGMVYHLLTKEAEHCLSLLKRVPPSPESTKAVADLDKYFSELAGVACKGEVDKEKGVEHLIAGVYRLIEVTYDSWPSYPRVTAPITEEEFVGYFMAIGHQAPEIADSFVYMDEAGLGQYPEAAGSDKGYLASMATAMNLARLVVNCFGTTNMQGLLQQHLSVAGCIFVPALSVYPQDGLEKEPASEGPESGRGAGAEEPPSGEAADQSARGAAGP